MVRRERLERYRAGIVERMAENEQMLADLSQGSIMRDGEDLQAILIADLKRIAELDRQHLANVDTMLAAAPG
ncbi:hypothetical protein MPLA_290045 [Mesorhizobium sp. ORS 3359]|nr:hypothetical protein MPLA_290045 [Mesorhizobium sp. ORS 3359]